MYLTLLNPLGLYEPFKPEQLKAIKLSEMRFTGAYNNTYGNPQWYNLNSHELKYQNVDKQDNSIVMSCINWITRNFPQADLTVARTFKNNRPENPDPEHPMVQLINTPNEWYDSDTLWAGTLSSYNLDGNAYWLQVRTGRGYGKTGELWYIPHWQIEPHWPEGRATNTYIDYYIYTVNGEQFKVDVENIVHFRNGIDPNNQRKGLSPLKSVLLEVFTDHQASRYTASLLQNMAIPGVVVIPKEGSIIDQTKVDAMKQTWKRKFGGENIGEPLIAGAPMEVTTIGFTPDQMDFEVIRRIPETRISGALGIPAIIAGLGAGISSMTKNDFEHAETYAFEQNLVPTWKSMARVLNKQLLPDFESRVQVKAYFDTSYVKALKENENEKQERGRLALTTGAITINEFRELAGWDKLKKEEGDVFLIPSMVEPITAERLAEKAKEDPAPPPQLAPQGDEDMPTGELTFGEKSVKAINEYDQFRLWRWERQVKATKVYDYDGLTVAREPTELEKQIDIKAIARDMESGKESISKVLLSIRERLIFEAAKRLSQMDGSYHELILKADKSDGSKLKKLVGDLVQSGRKQVAKELKAQGARVKSDPFFGDSLIEINGALVRSDSPLVDVLRRNPVDVPEGNGKMAQAVKKLAGQVGVHVYKATEESDFDELSQATLSRLINDVQARAVGAAISQKLLDIAEDEFAERIIKALRDGSNSYAERAAAEAANAAIGQGRRDEAFERSGEWKEIQFSSVLDSGTCSPCESEDGTSYGSLEDAPSTPYQECEGGASCRCVLIFVASDEV